MTRHGVAQEACNLGHMTTGAVHIPRQLLRTHLVPLIGFGVQVGFVEVLGEAWIGAHPTGEAQVVGVLNGGLGGTIQAKLRCRAVADLELLRCHADLAARDIVKDGRAIHRPCAWMRIQTEEQVCRTQEVHQNLPQIRVPL